MAASERRVDAARVPSTQDRLSLRAWIHKARRVAGVLVEHCCDLAQTQLESMAHGAWEIAGQWVGEPGAIEQLGLADDPSAFLEDAIRTVVRRVRSPADVERQWL